MTQLEPFARLHLTYFQYQKLILENPGSHAHLWAPGRMTLQNFFFGMGPAPECVYETFHCLLPKSL